MPRGDHFGGRHHHHGPHRRPEGPFFDFVNQLGAELDNFAQFAPFAFDFVAGEGPSRGGPCGAKGRGPPPPPSGGPCGAGAGGPHHGPGGRHGRRGGPFGPFGPFGAQSDANSDEEEIFVSPRKFRGGKWARFGWGGPSGDESGDDQPAPKVAPPVDVYSLDDSYVVIASVAGAVPREITVDFNSQTHELTIGGVINSGMQNITQEDRDKRRRIGERKVGEFERVIRVPAEPAVDEERIRAKYNNGLLKVTLPKVEPPQPAKRQYEVTIDDDSDVEVVDAPASSEKAQQASRDASADPEVSVPADDKSDEATLSDDGVVIEKPK